MERVPSPDKKHRLVILCPAGLLSDGLQSMLRQQKDLNVVVMHDDARAVMEELRVLQPDTVIMDSTGHSDVEAALALLHLDFEFRVILVDLERSGVSVFDKRQIVDGSWKDLLALIRRR